MKLAIEERVLITIPLTKRDANNQLVPDTNEDGKQKKVTVPARVSKFEEDVNGEIYTTFVFPSGKESIPYNRDQVKERVVPFLLKLSEKKEVEY